MCNTMRWRISVCHGQRRTSANPKPLGAVMRQYGRAKVNISSFLLFFLPLVDAASPRASPAYQTVLRSPKNPPHRDTALHHNLQMHPDPPSSCSSEFPFLGKPSINYFYSL